MAKKASSKPKRQQRRALLQPDSIPQVKKSLHLERQKFQDSKRGDLVATQLSFADLAQMEQESPMEFVLGLNLSLPERKALHSLQALLDQTNYEGNLPGEHLTSTIFKYSGLLPRLAINRSDYYRYYGIKPIRGKYQGRQRVEADEALNSLATEKRSVIYEKHRWEKGKRVSDIVMAKAPLIQIEMEAVAYQGLTQEEADRVKAGEELPGGFSGIIVKFGPLFMDQIDTFYLLAPVSLYEEIRELQGGRRASPAVPLFIDWLLTLDLAEIKIGKTSLSEKLGLSGHIAERHIKRLDKALGQCFETAQNLGFLLDYEEISGFDKLGTYLFKLNPDRCPRVRRKLIQKESWSS